MSSRTRRTTLAAYAAAIAASVTAAATTTAADIKVWDKVQGYCVQSWKNAGIDPQDWSDCTQQVMTELLERIPSERMDMAIRRADSEERLELKRAVWRNIQRWKRLPRHSELDEFGQPKSYDHSAEEEFEEVARAMNSLSTRQQQILSFWSEGWSINEISTQMGIPPARASDEKYKAIRKLQQMLVLSQSPDTI